MDVEQIFPGVWELRTSYGQDTAELFTDGPMPHAAWFIAGEQSAILDPGPTSIAEEILYAIRKLGYETDLIESIIPSHIHIDHAGAAGWMVDQLPSAKAIFHTRGAPFMRDVSRLTAGTADVFGEDWETIFGALLPVPDEKMVVVEDGTVLKLGDSDYRVVFMPGHSLDHIGIFDEANKALYCGHGLGNYKPHRYMPDPPMTLPYFDVDASIESIRKARKLNPEYLLPVHSGFLASNPSFAIDAVERVTIELGEIIKEGMSKGWSDPEIEISVCKYMFADPSKSDRSYIPLVVSYRKYYERQIMKAKKNL
ncbi:MAG: hypothetical protein CL777_00120 [Chloroflexi bacterium]|jgi:glyoxylase-like metal-dependent hydrolase (beta-lactamase superfamily II)|nr:hypothetical protein [Chloroflexota bacterium]MCH2531274.1 MBL fold metallo-hydrolase [Dehalococcoidia bacterium]|tara:strand:- start:466 stop:1395 length:930 start_codon:yes stop_codon:yes gene_type:complete